jgi:hypothetical protein
VDRPRGAHAGSLSRAPGQGRRRAPPLPAGPARGLLEPARLRPGAGTRAPPRPPLQPEDQPLRQSLRRRVDPLDVRRRRHPDRPRPLLARPSRRGTRRAPVPRQTRRRAHEPESHPHVARSRILFSPEAAHGRIPDLLEGRAGSRLRGLRPGRTRRADPSRASPRPLRSRDSFRIGPRALRTHPGHVRPRCRRANAACRASASSSSDGART